MTPADSMRDEDAERWSRSASASNPSSIASIACSVPLATDDGCGVSGKFNKALAKRYKVTNTKKLRTKFVGAKEGKSEVTSKSRGDESRLCVGNLLSNHPIKLA